MINLYRFLRYPNETLINFQGTLDSVKDLEQILHFKPRVSKISNNYERGYYAYVRGQWREKSEREVLAYLVKNYRPPDIELLMFQGKTTDIPDNLSASNYAGYISQKIQRSFNNKGTYICSNSGLAYEIFPKKPTQFTVNLEGFLGITYKIFLDLDNVPIIHVDMAYRYHLNGEFIRADELRSYTNTKVENAIKIFTTRNTNEVFKLAQNFINKLCTYVEPLGISFSSKPLTAKKIGFNTWLWSHDNPIDIRVGGNSRVPLAIEITKKNYSLYKSPEEQIEFVLLMPSDDTKRLSSFTKWPDIYSITRKKVDTFVPDVPCIVFEYSHLQNVSNQIGALKKHLQSKIGDRSPLFLMIIPPQTDKPNNPELEETQVLTGRFHKELRRIKRGAYVLTIDWDKICDDYARPYIIENSILKGITVMGAIPWLVQNIPFANQDKEICFIGIDINIKKPVPVVGGVILDKNGVLQGYQLVKIQSPNGDNISTQEFERLINGLVELYKRATGRYPEHLILHRDGIASPAELKISFLDEKSITVDVVEIRKSGSVRLKQPDNIEGTPSKDLAVCNEALGVAYLVNTLTQLEQLNNGKKVFPCPSTISIRKIVGETPLKLLSAQIYALSCANYNSFRRTVKLPITIAYADALVNNGKLKGTRNGLGHVVDKKTRLYWL